MKVLCLITGKEYEGTPIQFDSGWINLTTKKEVLIFKKDSKIHLILEE